MTTVRRVIGILLASALMLTVFSGCGTAPANTPVETTQTSPTAAGEPGARTIAGNTWGHGSWSIDIIFEACSALEESAGNVKLDVSNNEFRVDKVISDLQNQLTAGVDGVLFLGMSQTLFPTAAQICGNAEVPFVLHSNVPAEADQAAIESNPYYTGSVVSQEYGAGAGIAEIALADGNKTAIISAAALGDYTMEQRISGFTDTFEAGGGEVLYVSHSADPSEAVQKANDFMTAYPNADMVYGAGGDFVSATLSAMSSRPEIDYALYGSDVSPETAQSILDGDIKALNGCQWVAGSLAMALLVNRLDGHPILDETEIRPPLTT